MKEAPSADISVVIVSWNVRDRLERCLYLLERQKGVQAETYVVDNASTDGSVQLVRSRFRHVHLIENSRNRGFAAACNQAAGVARGAVILFLNPDTDLDDVYTLHATVKYLLHHPEVGVLGAKIMNDDGSIQRSVQRFPTLASQALVLLKLHAIQPSFAALKKYNASDFDYAHDEDVDQVKGAFFAVPRSVIQRVGMFDERFFVWFEEVDFCKRVCAQGLKVRFTPSIAVRHTGGASFHQLSSFRQQRLFNKSMLTYFAKHARQLDRLVLRVLTLPSMVLALFEPIFKKHPHVADR